jgi:hypothetical protein
MNTPPPADRLTLEDSREIARARVEAAARRAVGNPGESLYLVALRARLGELDVIVHALGRRAPSLVKQSNILNTTVPKTINRHERS